MKKVLVAASAVLFAFAVSAQTAPATSGKIGSQKTAEKKEVLTKEEKAGTKAKPMAEKSHKATKMTRHVSKPAMQEAKPAANVKK